jgi:hypothetical protein
MRRQAPVMDQGQFLFGISQGIEYFLLLWIMQYVLLGQRVIIEGDLAAFGDYLSGFTI